MLRQIIGVFAVLLIGIVLVKADPVQQFATETPAQINLAPIAQPQQADAATPTRTPTPEGGALLEAKEFANVRAQPSTDAAQLGTIRAGETYNVLGKYVSWIEFEYQSSPTGRGWVYGELVNLTGNTDSIPEVDPFSPEAALDSVSAGATATQNVITQTPGGVLTATLLAQQQQIAVPGAATAIDSGTREILPTFTYPPGILAAVPTPSASVSDTASTPTASAPAAPTSNTVPPIVPILVLGGIGLLGLAVSSLRRG